jgi:sigma-B regulation protein RsbU (phosphoserine phosphatase)
MQSRQPATPAAVPPDAPSPISAVETASGAVNHLLELLDSLPRIGDPRELLAQLVLAMRSAPDRACIILAQHESQPWSINPISPVAVTPALKELVLRVSRTPDPKLLTHLAVDQFQSAIAAPVFIAGQVTDWVLILDAQPDGLTSEDLQELIIRTRLIALAAEQLSVARELCAANLRVQDEIQQVASVQRALLPQRLPRIQGLDIAAWYSPVIHAGGDFYDFVRLSRANNADDPYAILIGDVSGHGPGAAVVMAMINAMLHAAPLEGAGPGTLLAHLNDHLTSKGFEGTFATAFLCVFDPRCRRITYASAGHPPALLITPGKSVALLDAAGDVPLGIATAQVFSEASLTLDPGQSILLYTDGITEAANPSDEFFHQDGLVRAVLNASTPQTILMASRLALSRHVGGHRQNDDQTLVAITAT